jgi:hypothetical protein
MQRGHAGTTLTFLQPRALTMLPKHNILNMYYKNPIQIMCTNKANFQIKIGTDLPDATGRGGRTIMVPLASLFQI